jgi:hypothetical protein
MNLKKSIIKSFFINLKLSILICLVFTVQSCIYYGGTDDSVNFWPEVPIVMDRMDFENAISFSAPKEMAKTGKIYVKDQYAFICDVNKGFHIFDYSDAENPVEIGFLTVPGATDMAIRNNLIYINQAVDLITVSYQSADNSFEVLHRARNVFPQKFSSQADYVDLAANQIVVDFVANI